MSIWNILLFFFPRLRIFVPFFDFHTCASLKENKLEDINPREENFKHQIQT